MNVLVAGGAGYIGSHTAKLLKQSGHNPVIYDNLSRGHKSVADILQIPAVWADLNDKPALTKALRDQGLSRRAPWGARQRVAGATPCNTFGATSRS